MIRIQQLKCSPGHTRRELEEKIQRFLCLRPGQIDSFQIIRQSIDARKKPDILFSYVVDVTVRNVDEKRLLARYRNRGVTLSESFSYHFPPSGSENLRHRPVIVGMGPAGLFCACYLAQAGYRPLVLERGEDVDSRRKNVEAFWNGGVCLPDSNVQFGEGGAGTFSDGKLNTLVKDKEGRNREVLRVFVEHGAPEQILYESHPHIGTDILACVVKSMRERILKLGGEIRFHAKMTDLICGGAGRITGVVCGDGEIIPADCVVLAIGHSARDTFDMLLRRGIPMEAKAFAVGLRVVHPQEMINLAQYGAAHIGQLPPASYKLTAQTSGGRGVYSFCMCPGGYVVNASSEPERLAVNGMSYSRRDGACANSAIIVSVTPEDYKEAGPLAGIAFQRRLEEEAFRLGKGRIPAQRYGAYADREKEMPRKRFIKEDFLPATRGAFLETDLRRLFPEPVRQAFLEGMESFDRIIPGFADDAAWLLGVESRTSSPVRIPRDSALQSECRGLYPCGEGAGYAGGITSAAMDGMRVAEAVVGRYRHPADST